MVVGKEYEVVGTHRHHFALPGGGGEGGEGGDRQQRGPDHV